MARVACTVMLKDEASLLRSFLSYHASLFGVENLYVFDNGSSDPEVLDALCSFEILGAHIDRSFRSTEDFRRKGEIVGDLVKQLDVAGRHDFYVLLDCDEFVLVRDEGRYVCDPSTIHACFDSMVGESRMLKVATNLSNLPGQLGKFQEAPYSKVIFPRDVLHVTDHGFHEGVARTKSGYVTCDIVYVHFHYRSYSELLHFSEQKLSAVLSPDLIHNHEFLRQYRGPGWHLVSHLLSGEEGYYKQFIGVKNVIHLDSLVERFRLLGIAPPFSAASDGPQVLPPAEPSTSRKDHMLIVIDQADSTHVRGWAINEKAPNEIADLKFLVNGSVVWAGLCDGSRVDVQESGRSTDRVGFSFVMTSTDASTQTLTVETRLGVEAGMMISGLYSLSVALPIVRPVLSLR